MNKKELMKMLKEKIDSCYRQLQDARRLKSPYVEGFRCRLDELLLFYSHAEHKSFMGVCEEFKIDYKDVDASSEVSE